MAFPLSQTHFFCWSHVILTCMAAAPLSSPPSPSFVPLLPALLNSDPSPAVFPPRRALSWKEAQLGHFESSQGLDHSSPFRYDQLALHSPHYPSSHTSASFTC